jgi:hypothetical protein
MTEPIISFCTVAMNRIDHIKQTLPVNLAENSLPSTQFLLLDYNSTDGLGDYIHENFQYEIDEGSLVYYNFRDADHFDRSHSRNMAFLLAEGAIVCNLDADNYAGPKFDQYVCSIFDSKKKICLTGLQNDWLSDASGKLCIRRSDFLEVTGYDETFQGYGFEDYDFVNRLQISGCDTYTINKKEFVSGITHSNAERLKNETMSNRIVSLYVQYLDEDQSILLYLLKDGCGHYGKVINRYTIDSLRPKRVSCESEPIPNQFIVESGWRQLKWCISEGFVHLESAGLPLRLSIECSGGENIFKDDDVVFHEISSAEMKWDAISFYSQTLNRDKLYENLRNKSVKVNRQFGHGLVFKNFKSEPLNI